MENRKATFNTDRGVSFSFVPIVEQVPMSWWQKLLRVFGLKPKYIVKNLGPVTETWRV